MELEENSNATTSAAFLRQLLERHIGPLKVIWDNAPVPRGEAVREYLWTPQLGLRLVNLPGYSPDFNTDGAGERGGDGEHVLGKEGQGAGEGQQLSRRAGQPERRDETSLPHRPAIKGRRATDRFPATSKCTSHLGFGLGCECAAIPAPVRALWLSTNVLGQGAAFTPCAPVSCSSRARTSAVSALASPGLFSCFWPFDSIFALRHCACASHGAFQSRFHTWSVLEWQSEGKTCTCPFL